MQAGNDADAPPSRSLPTHDLNVTVGNITGTSSGAGLLIRVEVRGKLDTGSEGQLALVGGGSVVAWRSKESLAAPFQNSSQLQARIGLQSAQEYFDLLLQGGERGWFPGAACGRAELFPTWTEGRMRVAIPHSLLMAAQASRVDIPSLAVRAFAAAEVTISGARSQRSD